LGCWPEAGEIFGNPGERKVLAGELQQKIKDLIAAKQSIRTVAKMLDISTRTVRKYK
jgi:hypothetical protein